MYVSNLTVCPDCLVSFWR